MLLDAGPIGPCQNASFELQVIIALFAALNTALATWLVNRRRRADVRDNGHHLERAEYRRNEVERSHEASLAKKMPDGKES